MFFKQRKAKYLVSESNPIIETYLLNERDNLRVSDNELYLYSIPVKVKDVESPMLESAIPDDSFETLAPAKFKLIS